MRKNEWKKVAVITGGSRGIGRAIALRLAQEKMDIAIIYSGNETAAQETCDEIKKQEVKTASYRCNVADYAQSKETVSQILKDFGKIDVLVNNAGITKDGLIFTMKEADYDAVMDINLKGAFHMIKHCYSHFEAKKRQHCEYQLCCRADGQCGAGQLFRVKSGIDRAYKIGSQRTGIPQNLLQCNCPRIYQNRNDRCAYARTAKGYFRADSHGRVWEP